MKPQASSGLYPHVYAIGDIHGCAAELEALLSQLTINEATTVIFLGDYIDRGPDSRQVIDMILKLKERCHVVALMGNHEAMLLDFLERPESVGSGLFVLNGGSATLANYAGSNGSWEIPEDHISFLKDLKLYYETETHFFVHAGVPFNKKLKDLDSVLDRESFLWIRGPFLSSKEKWGKMIVHGHTPQNQPERHPNRINLDTGCVFGGTLTAYNVNEDRFISVQRFHFDEDSVPMLREPGKRIAVRFNGRILVQARIPGQQIYKFETLNYNQFGLLLKEERPISGFRTGDVIEGTIGHDARTAVEFSGVVVRSESRSGITLLGVKIERVSTKNETGGMVTESGWLKRPAS